MGLLAESLAFEESLVSPESFVSEKSDSNFFVLSSAISVIPKIERKVRAYCGDAAIARHRGAYGAQPHSARPKTQLEFEFLIDAEHFVGVGNESRDAVFGWFAADFDDITAAGFLKDL